MQSLKARLIGVWLLSLLSSVVLGALLVGLNRQSGEAQRERAQAVLARACDLIRDRYAFYTTDWDGPVGSLDDPALRRDLRAVLQLALRRPAGGAGPIAGGIWAPGAGALASIGTEELPSAATVAIARVNAAASRADRLVAQTDAERSGPLLLAACPLDGPIDGATGWTGTSVPGESAPAPVRWALGSLLLLLLLLTTLLGRTLLVWGRSVRGIEAALGGGGGALPEMALPGERELDRIVRALNLAGRRLAEARAEAEQLADRVARSERLAALGRMAAGLAHEIRNPIAAARLQGENALAGDDGRRREAIGDMLEQLGRLDALVSELLAMTQRVEPQPVPTELATFLPAVAARYEAAAAARGVRLLVDAPAGTVPLDPAIVSRILDNLLGNAVRHAAPGGAVRLLARREAGTVRVSVCDDGAGVPPDMETRLFEPFVTGRADGTGLGLAIARELADAHGGRLLLRHRGGDGAPTDFTLELPD